MAQGDASAHAAGSRFLGLFFIIVAALFIGLMPNAAKLAYGEGANPIAVLVIRAVVAVTGLAVFLRMRGNMLSIPRPFVRKTALAGIAMLFSAGGGMSAVAYIDVSLASVLFFTFPFFVAAVNHFRGLTRLGRAEVICMILAFLGLALALGVSLENANLTGIALALVSSLGIAVTVLATTDTSIALGAVRANLHMTLWAGAYFILLAVLGPLTGAMQPMRFPANAVGWGWVLAAGVSFTLGYLFFFIAATILGATKASVLSILEPIMMIAFAVILVGETLSPLQALGVTLVFGSLIAFDLVPKRA
ncbi:DMT family transporter [Defluviimonas sp. WL0050]|uniref:DMT family transporter n=1 Tax=Albidovulum litorale TaxID=2984134 RepID=A0ABT2ZJG4_9RHOB|nr:DMT family transporter [Defluviimonas sp. WL0050]MCV2871266.1 DMT family transporter [Defluviimonas sp. WL0050]